MLSSILHASWQLPPCVRHSVHCTALTVEIRWNVTDSAVYSTPVCHSAVLCCLVFRCYGYPVTDCGCFTCYLWENILFDLLWSLEETISHIIVIIMTYRALDSRDDARPRGP